MFRIGTHLLVKETGNILIVDDDAGVLQTAKFILKQHFTSITLTQKPEEIAFLLGQKQYDVVLLDMNFRPGETTGDEGLTRLKEIVTKSPNTSVVMITAYGELKLAVEAMKNGATDFIVKPWENEKFIATILSAFQLSTSKKQVSTLKSINKSIVNPQTQVIGESTAIKQVKSLVDKVAPTEAAALILGENGTGKELFAKLIHEKSNRNDMPFVKVDLGSLSSTLFESELFGHEKGAFTDAHKQKEGRFELASGGTLFLDEIGNIDPTLQSKLLSVIQNQEVYRLGSNAAIPIDLRLVCATNLDIHKEVHEGRFREDLYYRLNTFEITIPPLRDRREDIQPLCEYFIKSLSKRYRIEGLSISSEAIKKLRNWNWPGNIRELEHTIERAVILTEDNIVQAGDLQLSGRSIEVITGEVNFKHLEKDAIQRALLKHNGNMSQVAKELGVGRTTLYRKLKKYDL